MTWCETSEKVLPNPHETSLVGKLLEPENPHAFPTPNVGFSLSENTLYTFLKIWP